MTAQAQYSLTEQLGELHVLGVQHGLYDAVDWLTDTVERQQGLARVRALVSWIDGACVDELPHDEIRAAIGRWRNDA